MNENDVSDKDFKEQGFHSKSEMRRMEIQKPPTLEQKIEAEFEKYFADEILKAPSEELKDEFTGLKDVLYFPYRAAALPLHKEIQELRAGLEYYADKSNWHFEIDGREEGEYARKILSGVKP